ncbi:MAG: hypothetical protein AAGF12_36990 [Myxococcota bacterium]
METPPATAERTVGEASRYVVQFDEGQLIECVELRFSLALLPAFAGDPPSGAQRRVEDAVDQFVSQLTDGDHVAVEQPCDDAFADRLVLGSCTSEDADSSEDLPGVVTRSAFTARYYGFGPVFGSDRLMQDCLNRGGRWHSIDRESPEFLRARLEHRTEEARRALR